VKKQVNEFVILDLMNINVLLFFKSHNIAIPSLPPDAHNDPSGDTVTELIKD